MDQSDSAHDVFYKRNREDPVRLMGNVNVLGAHGHIIRPDLMFYHWNGSLRTAKEKVRDVKEQLEREKENVPETLEAEDQAISYIKTCGVYSCGPRQRDIFCASASEIKISF